MPAQHAYVPDMNQLMTAEELLSTNVPNKRTELVRGRLIVHEPPGGRHGYIAANLAFQLNQHIDLTAAGAVFVGDVGFTLRRDPDTVRGPDVAFVRKDRLPQPIPNSSLPGRRNGVHAERDRPVARRGRPAGLQLHTSVDSGLGVLAYLPARSDLPAAFHSAAAAVPDFVVQVHRRAHVTRHHPDFLSDAAVAPSRDSPFVRG